MSTETELAWAAGFFEGEGCIFYPRGYRSVHLIIGQSADDESEPPSLRRFRQAVGDLGQITPVPPNQLSRKPRWRWRTQRRNESVAILTMIAPYMTEKPPIPEFL